MPAPLRVCKARLEAGRFSYGNTRIIASFSTVMFSGNEIMPTAERAWR
jgi:hypothetical protein